MFSPQQLEVLEGIREASARSGFAERYDAELAATSNMWRDIVTKETDRSLAEGFTGVVDQMEGASRVDASLAFRTKKVQQGHSVLGGAALNTLYVFKINPETGTELPKSEAAVGSLDESEGEIKASIGFTPEDVVFAAAQLQVQRSVELNFDEPAPKSRPAVLVLAQKAVDWFRT